MFGPAKLAVQITRCLSSASEISHSKGGDTLNLVSGRRLEKHNHHPPKKQELLPNRPLERPPICVPNPSYFLVVAVVWCARSNKREETGRFSSFH